MNKEKPITNIPAKESNSLLGSQKIHTQTIKREKKRKETRASCVNPEISTAKEKK
jgi:hypothetical protein